MVDYERLFNRIREMAEEEFSVPKEDFHEVAVMRDAPLSFDDLMMVELMFTIEEEFANCKIDFDRDRFCNCVTFGDIVRFTQTHLEGKESELEADYREQDASIAAYEKDKELGTWLADDFHVRPRAVASKPTRQTRTAKSEVAESVRKPRRRTATAESHIRKLKSEKNGRPSGENTGNKKENNTKERHGRYRRRKENGNEESGT